MPVSNPPTPAPIRENADPADPHPAFFRLCQRFLGGFLVGSGFIGEVGFDEELGDFLFLRGEGAEVGDASELFGGGGGFLRRGWTLAGEVAGGTAVGGEQAGGGELLDGCQVASSMTWSFGSLPRQSVS